MKPGIIAVDLDQRTKLDRLLKWFTANGLRHYVPEDARIIFTGNRLIIPTYDVERVGQTRKAWANHRFLRGAYGQITGLPIKVRTYRVRVPFEAVK